MATEAGLPDADSESRYPLSYGGRSTDFPVRSKLLPHDRDANRVQVGARTALRAGKSALRDSRPPSLTGYESRNFHHWNGRAGML